MMVAKKNGFTLIEVILSLAAIATIAGMAVPVYQAFQVRNDLDIAAATLVQGLRRAQILSQAVDGDTSWGAIIQSGGITIFKGSAYATRDATFDEISAVPASIIPSGVSEIVFSKFTGVPQATGVIVLTSNANETRTITINAKGTVNY